MVVEGECGPVASILGLVTLLSGVSLDELPHVALVDREYVASEMTAFLLAWLSSLGSRVVNRPTPLCLSGPRLHPEQWARFAASAGLSVRPVTRCVPPFEAWDDPDFTALARGGLTAPGTSAYLTVPVLAGRCLSPHTGEPLPAQIARGLECLADSTGARLLTAILEPENDGFLFAGASPGVDASRDDVADALLAALRGAA